MPIQAFPIQTGVIQQGSNLSDVIVNSIQNVGIQVDDEDILVITSKVISVVEGQMRLLASVEPSKEAISLARNTNMDPAFVELVLQNADEVVGSVYGAILTIKNGFAIANAGIDASNAPKGHVILWPEHVHESCQNLRLEISKRLHKNINIMIIDSRTTPLRMGTTSVTISTAGFEPILDERGKNDLYGKELRITRRAFADNIASLAGLIMGEAAESIPAVIVKGINVPKSSLPADELASLGKISPSECLYFSTINQNSVDRNFNIPCRSEVWEGIIEGIQGTVKVGDEHPVCLVGIINVSPESFFVDAVQTNPKDIGMLALAHEEEGASIIDVGAQSTAPVRLYGHSIRVSSEEEQNRIRAALAAIKDSGVSLPISVDTQRSEVAELALNHGASIINDISGLTADPHMPKTIANHDSGVILMACKKSPGDVTAIPDILEALSSSVNVAIKAGIEKSRIAVDPGIGAWDSRSPEHDFEILSKIDELRRMNLPIYVGISRKSFVGSIFNLAPSERLFGSLGATIIAVTKGVHILRTHDVRPTLEAVRIAERIINGQH